MTTDHARTNTNQPAILAHLGIRGSMSRAELARVLGVTPPLITLLTRRLIADGLVRELDQVPSRGGRPARMLGLVSSIGNAIGVRIDLGQLSLVEVRIDGTVERSNTVPFNSTSNMALAELTESLRDFVGTRTGHLLGIGVAIPGTINDQKSGSVDSSQLNWSRVALGAALRRALQLPVLVDNNINVLSTAEKLFGQGHNFENFLVISIGTNVELGIVCHSEIFRGHAGGAGGLSHFPVGEEGPVCQCGNSGCLEVYVGEEALVKAAQKQKLLGKLEGISSLKVKASEGNQDARTIFQHAGQVLGRVVAGAANILDPEAIIILGENIDAWNHWSPGFEPAFRSSLVSNKRGVPIIVESWKQDNRARSAACLVLAAPFDANGVTGEQGELVRARLLQIASRPNAG